MSATTLLRRYYYSTSGGDVTAPVLSSPTGAATGPTSASGGVTTDEGNGTLYQVTTQVITTPSVAQIKAGLDHLGASADASLSQAVSASGVQSTNIGGLASSTGYYHHFVHTDTAGNDSNAVTSAQFTTSAPSTGTTRSRSTRRGRGLF